MSTSDTSQIQVDPSQDDTERMENRTEVLEDVGSLLLDERSYDFTQGIFEKNAEEKIFLNAKSEDPAFDKKDESSEIYKVIEEFEETGEHEKIDGSHVATLDVAEPLASVQDEDKKHFSDINLEAFHASESAENISESSLESNTVHEQTVINIIPEDSHGDDLNQIVLKPKMDLSVNKDADLVVVLDSALMPSSCSSDTMSEESTEERTCDITQSETPIKFHGESQENAGDVKIVPVEGDTEPRLGIQTAFMLDSTVVEEETEKINLDFNVLVSQVEFVEDKVTVESNMTSNTSYTNKEALEGSENVEDVSVVTATGHLQDVFLAGSEETNTGSEKTEIFINPDDSQEDEEKDRGDERVTAAATGLDSESQEQKNVIDHDILQTIVYVRDNEKHEIAESSVQELYDEVAEKWHGDDTSKHEQKSLINISDTQDDPPQTDSDNCLESEWEVVEVRDGETEDTAVYDEATKLEEILTVEEMNSTVTVTSVTHQQSEEEETSLSANTENAAIDRTNETSDVNDNDSQPDLQKILTEEENYTTLQMNLDELQVTEHAESVSTVTESGPSFGDISGESHTVHENITKIPEDSQKEEIQSEFNPFVHKRKMGSTRRPLRGNKGQRKNREQYEESESLNSESLIDEEKEQEREISVEKDAAPVEVLDFALMPSSCSSDLVSEESTIERISDITQSQTAIKCHTESQENAGDIDREPTEQNTEAIVGATVTVDSNMTIESDFLHYNPHDTNEEELKGSDNVEGISAKTDAGLLQQGVDSEKTDAVSENTEISINPDDSQGEDSQSKLSPVVHKRKMGSTRRPLRGNKEKGQDVKEKEEKTNKDETEPHSEIQEPKNVVDPMMQEIIDVGYKKDEDISETVKVAEEKPSEHPFENKEWHGEITSEQEQKSSSVISQTQDDPPQVDTERTMENESEAGEEKDGETENTAVNDEDITSEEILTPEDMNLTVTVTSVTHQQNEEEETSLSANTENAAFERTNETSDERKEIEDFTESKVAEHLTNVNVQDNDSQSDLQTENPENNRVLTEEENDTTLHMNLEELQVTEHAQNIFNVTETDLSYGDEVKVDSGELLTVHENITEIPEDSQKEEIQSELNPFVHKRKMGSTRRPLRGNKGQRKNREQYEESESLNSKSLIDEEKEQEREISVEKDAAPVEMLDSPLMPSSCSSDFVSEESTEERISDITQSQTTIECQTESQENAGDVEREPIDQDTKPHLEIQTEIKMLDSSTTEGEGTEESIFEVNVVNKQVKFVGDTVTVQSSITVESDFLQNNTSDTNKESFEASENVESVSALTDAGLLLQDVDSEKTDPVSEKTEISINPEDSQGEDSQSKLNPFVHKRKMGSTRRPLKGNKEKIKSGQEIKEGASEEVSEEDTGLHLETRDQNNVIDHNIMQTIINVRDNEEHEITETVSRSTQELCGYAADKEKLHGEITSEQQQMSSSNLSQTQDDPPHVDTVVMLESIREVGEEKDGETEDTAVNDEATKSEEIFALENKTLTVPVTSVTHQHSEEEETSLSVNTENAAFDMINETGDESKDIEDFTERKEAEHLTNANIQDDNSQPDLQTVLTKEENDTTTYMNLEEIPAESISTVTESGLSYGDVSGESHTVHENITEIPEDSQKEEIQSELNPFVHKRKMGSTRRPLRGNKGQRKNREQYEESETLNRESLISDETEQEREISVEKDAASLEVLDSALMPSSHSSDLVSEKSTAERISDITQSQTPIKCHTESQENAGDVEGEPIEQNTEATVETTVIMQSNITIEQNNPHDTNEEMLKGSVNVEGVSVVTDAGLFMQDVDSEKTDATSEKTKISINPEDSQEEDSQSKLNPVVHKRKMGSTRRPLKGNKEKGQDVKEKEEKTFEDETEPHIESQEQKICVDPIMQKNMDVGYNKEEETPETVRVAEEELTEHLFKNKEWHGEITSEQEQKSSSDISQTQDDPPQVDTKRTMENESEAGEKKDGETENTAVNDDAGGTEKILTIEDMNSTVTFVTHQQSEDEETSHSANTEHAAFDRTNETSDESKQFKDFTETEVAEHLINVNVQDNDNQPDLQTENQENNKVLTEDENYTTLHMNQEELQVTEHAENISTVTESGLSYRDVVTVVSEESLTVDENITEIPEDSQKEEIQSELNPIFHKRKMGSTRRPLRGNKGQRENREQYEESESLNSESLIDEEKEQEREISVEKDAAPVEVLDSALMPSYSSDLVSEESTKERICDITQSQTLMKVHADTQDKEPIEQDTEASVGVTVTMESSMTIESGFLHDNPLDTNQKAFNASENVESVSALTDAGLLLQDVDSGETSRISEKTEISTNPEDSQEENSQSKLTPVVHKRKMGSTRRPLKGNKEKIKSGKEIKEGASEEVSEEGTGLHLETPDQNNLTDHDLQTIMDLRHNEEHEITETVSRSTQELYDDAAHEEKWHGEITSEQQQMSSSNLSQTQDDSPQFDTVRLLESKREVREEKEGETEDIAVNDEATMSEEIFTLENMTLTVPVTSVTHQQSEEEETSLSVNTENAAFDRKNETSEGSKEIENFTERKEAEHLTNVNIQDNYSQPDLQTVLTEEETDTMPHMNLEELNKTENAECVSTVTESGLSYRDILGESHTVHENITEIPEDSQKKEEIQSELNPIVHKRKMGSTRRPLRGNKGQRKNREQYEESETLNRESLISDETEQEREISVEKDAAPVEVLDSALMLSSYSSDFVSEEPTAERICDLTQSQTPLKCHTESQENGGDVEGEQLDQDTETTVTMQSNITIESDFFQNNTSDTNQESFEASDNVEGVSALSDAGLLLHVDLGETSRVPEKTEISINPEDSQGEDSQSKMNPVIPKRKMGSTRRPLRGNKEKGQVVKEKEEKTFEDETEPHIENQEQKICVDPMMQEIIDVGYNKEEEISETVRVAEEKLSEHPFENKEWHGEITSEQEQKSSSIISQTQDDPQEVDTERTIEGESEAREKTEGETENTALKILPIEDVHSTVTSVTKQQSEEEEVSHSANTEHKKFEDFTETEVAEHLTNVNVQDNDSQTDLQTENPENNKVLTEEENDTTPNMNLEELHVTEHAESVSTVTESGLSYRDVVTVVSEESLTVQENITEIPEDSQEEEIQSELNPIVHKRKMGSTRRPLRGNKGQRKNREQYEESETLNSESLIDEEKEQERNISVDAALVEVHADTQEREPIEQDTEAFVGATVTVKSNMTIESDFLHDDTNQEALKASENVESVSAVTDAGLLLQDVDSGETSRVSEKTEISFNPNDSQEDSQLKLSPVVPKRKMGSTRRPLRGNKEKGQDVKEKEEKINEVETEPHYKIQEQNIFVDPMMPKMLDVGYNKEEEISETNYQINQTKQAGVEEHLTNVNALDNDSQSDLQLENPDKNILPAERDTHAHLEIQTEIKMFDSAIVGREGTEESLGDVNDPMRQVEFVVSDIIQQALEASKNVESVSAVSDAGLQKDVGSEETNTEDSQSKFTPVVQKRKMGSTRRPLRGKTEKENDGERKANEDDTKPHSEIQDQNNVVVKTLMNVEHIVLTEEGNDSTPHTNLEELQETEHAESISTLTTCGFSYGDVVTGESQTVQETITEIPEDSQKEEIQSNLNPLVQKRKMGSTRKPLRGNKGQRKNREQYDESETLNRESLISDEKEQEREISVEKDAASVEVLGSALIPSSDFVSEESTAERICDITQSQTLHADTQDNTGNVESLPAERDTNAHLEFQTEIKMFDTAIVGREGTEMKICDVNVLMRQVEFVTSENVESVSAVSDAGLQKDVGSEETNTISVKTEIGINPEDTQREDSQSKLSPVVQKRKMGSTRRPLRGNKEKEDFQEKDGEEKANKEDTEPHLEIQDQNNVVDQKMKNVEHNEDKETSETVKIAEQEISEHPSENKEWHRRITLEEEQKSSSDIFQTQTGPSQDDNHHQNLPEIQEKRSDVLLMEENQIHILSQPVVMVESPQTEDGEIHSVSSSSMQKRRMGSTRKTLRGKKSENEREVGNENNGEIQNVQTDDGATKSEEKFTLEEATSLTITRTYVCHQQPFNSTPKQGHDIQDNESELDKQTENPEENEGSEERSDPNSYTNPEPLNVPECADPTRPTEPETVTTDKRRKMGSTRKNFRGKREVKREESEGTDSHVQIQIAPRDDQNSDQIIHDSPEHSESSLLSEIERVLNQTSQSSQNQLIINDPNSGGLVNAPVETSDKDSLQVTQSQRPESPSELGSPGRRRKMGSTRKSPRQQLQVKREDEEMAEDLEKNKQEPKVLKKDLETAEESKVCEIEDQEGNKECLDVPIGLKTSCQLEESAKSGIQESTSPSTKRKFGSRRTNMAKRDLGELNPSECENEERHSDDIMIKKAGQTGRSPGQKQAIDLKNRTEQDMEMVQFNVVMVGDSCVGKTSFVRRFHKGYFTPDYSSTIGVDTCVQNVVLDERVVKLHIWDTAGQERFHSITTQVFHRANGLLLMYDITSSKSFMSVRNWITQVQEKAPDDVVMMLLGNKNDSVEREVQVQEGEDLAREYKIHFMECSAATGDNVSECMKSLAELLVQRKRQKVEKHTALKREQPQKKSGCC
ncbi:uncharacterized protein rab44 [Misgurnus anguillicaudatus]|uniref:uncharacterized protein rab44 n=1 Tax=Misgurnus anguillicaudatus TaxID=75329 RepID=UPI003CCFDA4A